MYSSELQLKKVPVSSSELQLEKAFLAADLLFGVGYGLQLALYCSCARHLWWYNGRSRLVFLAYITLLILLESLLILAQSENMQFLFITVLMRDEPGGPWHYLAYQEYTTYNEIFRPAISVISFLSNAFMVWRCWVVWVGSGRVVLYSLTIVLGLLVILSAACGMFWLVMTSQGQFRTGILGLPYWFFTFAVNSVLTSFIVSRLLVYRHRISNGASSEHARYFIRFRTMLVESAALNSIFSIVFLALYAARSPIYPAFLAASTAAQQISVYLIIRRIAEERAWTSETPWHIKSSDSKHFLRPILV